MRLPKFKVHRLPSAALILCSLLTLLMAKSEPSPSTDPQSIVPQTDDWPTIRRTSVTPLITGSTTEEKAVSRASVAQSLVDEADRLNQFQKTATLPKESKEAARQEALALLSAESLGNVSQTERRRALVSSIRADTAIPTAKRSEVAAGSDNLDVIRRPHASAAERMADFEQVARGLIEEFPDVPDSYEALVRIGRDSSDSEAKRIMREVLSMDAPEKAKDMARVISGRLNLVGRKPVDFTKLGVAPDPNATTVAKPPKSTLIYTWATFSPASIALAQRIGEKADPDTLIIGINLDTDIEAAQVLAASQSLPGRQLYDPKGRDGPIPRQLFMSDLSLVYRADDTGAVVSVAAHRDFPPTQAANRQP